jgi:hypothetical protein
MVIDRLERDREYGELRCEKPSARISRRKSVMASQEQRRAAKKNIKKAIKAAKRKQTLKHLPKKTRQALGKQAAKVRQSRT